MIVDHNTLYINMAAILRVYCSPVRVEPNMLHAFDRHNVSVLSYSVLPAVSYHVIDSALYCITKFHTSWKVFLHCVQPITYTHVISNSSIALSIVVLTWRLY